MGPGGPHGLQLRWRASFGVRGGFDSLALPPVQVIITSVTTEAESWITAHSMEAQMLTCPNCDIENAET